MRTSASTVLLTLTMLAQAPGIVGNWIGTLAAGPQKLRIGLHVRERDGGISATLDSIDQGAMGIPIDSISASGGRVRFTVKTIAGSYEGTLTGGKIQGAWSQAGMSLPLTFEPLSKEDAAAPPRLQQPSPPLPYNSEDVEIANGGIRLAGTFTAPRSGGPFPAALLVSGSGPQDRDETLFGHKPFLVLSDYLTRAGIAVLRMDDRGFGKSSGDFQKAGLKEFTSDALAGVAWLKSRKDVNSARIGIIGHSEGGAVAPLAAVESKDVAFIVMMAGPAVPFDQLLERQAADLMKAGGAPEAAITANQKLQARAFEVLRDEPDDERAKQRLHGIASDVKTQSPQLGALFEAQIGRLVTPEIRSLLSYNGAETLRKVTCPVLAIDGAKDLQVSADANLPAIAAALAAGHNPDFAVEKLPGLNHLFQTAKTGSIAEYGQIEETISPRALRLMGDWVTSVTR